MFTRQHAEFIVMMKMPKNQPDSRQEEDKSRFLASGKSFAAVRFVGP